MYVTYTDKIVTRADVDPDDPDFFAKVSEARFGNPTARLEQANKAMEWVRTDIDPSEW